MSKLPTRLRDDLLFTRLPGKRGGYVIEDPLRNMFFKIGRSEYQFLCRMSRGDDLSHLLEETGEDGEKEHIIAKEEALRILQWLAGRQLLQNQNVETLQLIETAEESAKQQSWLSRLNLISFRVPLGNPDPILSRILPWLNWLTGPLFFALWLLLGSVSLTLLFVNWQSFCDQTAGIFSFSNMLIIGFIWIALKVVHELFHALSCARYGGQVPEMGILFILFIPLAYVDASSSWSFSSRWQRIHVAIAGIYIELFVAWLAILYWVTHSGTPGGLLAHNTVLVAGVSSLLFNANPLMRFDGYYVLSDLVQIPNLYFHGMSSVCRKLKKFWFNIDEPGIAAQPGFVTLYGVGLYLWRVLVLCTLGYLAAGMFSGWGILLTIMAAAGWILLPLYAFWKKIPGYLEQNPALLSHFIPRFLSVGLIAGFLLFGVRWEKNISIPAVVLFEEQHSIRTGAEGFVEQLFVKEGELVETGQKLLKLENKEIESSVKKLAIELEILELNRRQAISSGQHAQLQMLNEQKKVLQKKQTNLNADYQGLEIYAPGSGKVVGRDLERLLGTWVHKGEELFQIVSPDNKHLVASVSQDDIGALSGREGEEVLIDMSDGGLGQFTGRIGKLTPTASQRLPHPSMAASYGGAFDVKPVESNVDGEGLILFAPRFSVTIQLPDTVKQKLRSGQQANVQIRGDSRTLANIIWKGLRDWFLNRQSPL